MVALIDKGTQPRLRPQITRLLIVGILEKVPLNLGNPHICKAFALNLMIMIDPYSMGVVLPNRSPKHFSPTEPEMQAGVYRHVEV